MNGMNGFLAQHYQTVSASAPEVEASHEDTEKQAQVELFSKLAAEENIDLSSCNDDQLKVLWDTFQTNLEKSASEESSKAAAEECPPDDKAKKMEKAKEEHEEKKAQAEKFAEADFLGRTMAHAYVDELKKIAAAQEASTPEVKEEPAPAVEESKVASVADRLKNFGTAAASKAKDLGSKAKDTAGAASEVAKKHVSDNKGKYQLGGAAAGGAAVGGAAGYFAGKKKEGSAIDELAVEVALKTAAEAGFDPEEAGNRLAAVMVLGPVESTKIAGVEDHEQAIGVRALELLELAGYPVTWNQ